MALLHDPQRTNAVGRPSEFGGFISPVFRLSDAQKQGAALIWLGVGVQAGDGEAGIAQRVAHQGNADTTI